LLISQFLFFPWVEVSLSRGLCCSGPGLSVGVPQYRETHLVRVFPSRLGAVTGCPGALLVSPFNMKWRFSALAGRVEGSKLCLFSVIMPAKCVSSAFPRFHYRRLTFCFLPLAAIFLYGHLLNICLSCSPHHHPKSTEGGYLESTFLTSFPGDNDSYPGLVLLAMPTQKWCRFRQKGILVSSSWWKIKSFKVGLANSGICRAHKDNFNKEIGQIGTKRTLKSMPHAM
jgi:hypothetical protein